MTEKFKSEPRIGGKDWISILALNLTGNIILEWSCNFPSYSLGSLAIKRIIWFSFVIKHIEIL